MCLQITLGEDHGSGHFYLAKTRTFLLCVDMRVCITRNLVRHRILYSEQTLLIVTSAGFSTYLPWKTENQADIFLRLDGLSV